MRRLRGPQVRMASLPRLTRVLFVFVLLIPFLLALSVAFDGHVQLSALVGPFFGCVLASFFGQRDVVKLDRPARRAAAEVTMSGRPAPSPDVNRVAEQRLERAARTPAAFNRTVLVIIVLVTIVVPVVAASRSSPWWLSGWTAIPILMVTTPLESFTVSAAARLVTLRQALGTGLQAPM